LERAHIVFELYQELLHYHEEFVIDNQAVVFHNSFVLEMFVI